MGNSECRCVVIGVRGNRGVRPAVNSRQCLQMVAVSSEADDGSLALHSGAAGGLSHIGRRLFR